MRLSMLGPLYMFCESPPPMHKTYWRTSGLKIFKNTIKMIRSLKNVLELYLARGREQKTKQECKFFVRTFLTFWRVFNVDMCVNIRLCKVSYAFFSLSILDRGIRALGMDFDSITHVDILRVKRPLTWQSLNLAPLYLISCEYCAASLTLRTTTMRRSRRPKS